MLDSYVDAIQQHVCESVEDLNSLHQILQVRSWTRIERKGAERLIQALTEACVGIAKHWLKKQGKVIPSDAYAVFEKLFELHQLLPGDALEWLKNISMRNAPVHDYLNLDEKVITATI